MVTLQEIIDAITNGTRAEKEVFAGLIVQADDFLKNTQSAAAAAQKAIDMGIAQTWFDNTVQPQIKWRNTQALKIQRANILIDYELVKSLLETETDPFRREIIKTKLQQANTKFRQIKATIKGG